MVDFYDPSGWRKSCDVWKTVIGHSQSEISLGLFPNLASALIEVIFSLKSQFPFKKKLYFQKGVSPWVEHAVRIAAREGLLVADVSTVKENLPAKEVLAAICVADDPFSGEIFDLSAHAEFCQDVPNLFVSHSVWRRYSRKSPQLINERSYEIQLVSKSLAVAYWSSVGRFAPHQAETFSYTHDFLLSQAAQVHGFEEDQSSVETFERKLSSFGESFFARKAAARRTSRLFDRAVLMFPDLDASAVIAMLNEPRTCPLGADQSVTGLSTLSLSTVGGLRTTEYLTALQLTPQEKRGLLLISLQRIRQGIEPHLISTLQSVRNLQG